MVFIWPWKSDDTSPASFEKTLSTLATKINKSTTRLDNLRQRSRRFNALWILYSSFAYLLYSIILVLVVGWKNWGLVEIGAVFGGPVLIYGVRLALGTYYNYRTSKVQAHLEELQKQRDVTIEKLKSTTKYNTTQELLKKYGGSPPTKNKSIGPSDGRPSPKDGVSSVSRGGRTSFVPPPTANIPGKLAQVSFPNTPQQTLPQSRSPLGQATPLSASPLTAASQRMPSPPHESAEFAPNAYSAEPQYAQSGEGSHWYDRLMDVLLGEDESLPRNRLALICKKCRLVNGQAPPGAKRPEDVGKWRCGECGTLNGEETETKKIIANIKEEAKSTVDRSSTKQQMPDMSDEEDTGDRDTFIGEGEGEESDVTQYSSNDDSGFQSKVEAPQVVKEAEPVEKLLHVAEPETPKRKVGRPKGSKKKNT